MDIQLTKDNIFEMPVADGINNAALRVYDPNEGLVLYASTRIDTLELSDGKARCVLQEGSAFRYELRSLDGQKEIIGKGYILPFEAKSSKKKPVTQEAEI